MPGRFNTRRLMVRQRAVLGGVQIASLLGLEELRPDGHGRPVPPQPPHDIAGTRLVPLPTGWQ